jgi:very-short-patch-repair endonuclease
MSTERARVLRRSQTDAERKLWFALRARRFHPYKFRRQVPLGRYIADFVCFERKLVIEVDGDQHSEQIEYDEARTQWLATQGYRVIRFGNRDVSTNFEGVLEAIWAAAQAS